MFSTVWRKRSIAVFVAVFMLIGTVAVPQSYDPDQDLPRPTLWQKRIEKLGRGVSNILFGWAEIPRAWHIGVTRQQPLTQILTHGTIVGTSRFLIRTGLGVYETFTFFMSSDERKYEPMIEPEYLF
jgi:putative exosortase-associated protein (TIGR04073 family)